MLGLTDAKRIAPWTPAAKQAYPELTGKERRGKDARNVEIPIAPEFRLIEVKASRADFLVGVRKGQISNQSGGFGSRADYCYIFCPWGVVLPEDVPDEWGLFWWWEGPSQKLFWCTKEHSENVVHPRKRVRIKAGTALDVAVSLGLTEAVHLHTATARSFHTLEGEVRNQLLRVKPARRLNPAQPLHARAEIVKAAMLQSVFWRHYGNVDYEMQGPPVTDRPVDLELDVDTLEDAPSPEREERREIPRD